MTTYILERQDPDDFSWYRVDVLHGLYGAAVELAAITGHNRDSIAEMLAAGDTVEGTSTTTGRTFRIRP